MKGKRSAPDARVARVQTRQEYVDEVDQSGRDRLLRRVEQPTQSVHSVLSSQSPVLSRLSNHI